MEKKCEFSTGSDGIVIVRTESGVRIFTQRDRDLIEFILKEVKEHYPETYERLCILYEKYKGNTINYEYRMALRFIKCNMGSDDLLSFDIVGNKMNFERMTCPLRGECEEEGIICCPLAGLKLSSRLRKIARYHAMGVKHKEIADLYGVSLKTIENELQIIKKTLKLKSVKDIVKYVHFYIL